MRADLKDVELEQEAAQDQVEVLEEQETVEQRDEVEGSALRFHELAGFIEALIAGRSSELDERAQLSELERAGLGLIRQAIEGRGLAEDRLVMLNDALAVLQPALAAGVETASIEAHDVYDRLVVEIAELKQSLESLADAQEELFLHDLAQVREGEDAKPDKPKPKPIDAGEVGDDRPSTLAGPGPAVEKPVAPSALAGPGPAVEKPVVPTTLTGPGPAADKPIVPSTVYDGPEKK